MMRQKKEDGQLDKDDSDESDDEEHWAARIRKQNADEWKAMMKHVRRIKNKPAAAHMFKVFKHKFDENDQLQTMCVLRQRLCVLALEGGHKGGVF